MRTFVAALTMLGVFGVTKFVGYVRGFLAALRDIAPDCGDDE